VSRTEPDAFSLALERDPGAVRAFADGLPHFVFTAQADGTVQYVNAPFRAYSGLPAQPARGAFEGIIHPEDLERARRVWARANGRVTPYDIELRMREAASGIYRWFVVRANPLVRSGGSLNLWLGTASDIDDRKRASDNLNFIIGASTMFNAAATVDDVAREFARQAVVHFADWCIVAFGEKKEDFRIAALDHRDGARAGAIKTLIERYPPTGGETFFEVLRSGTEVVIPQITDEVLQQTAQSGEHLALLKSLNLTSAIIMPLVSDGNVLGGVVMYTADLGARFQTEDVNIVRLLADRAAEAISRRSAISEEHRVKRRLQFIGRATQLIYESLDPAATFRELMRLLVSSIADFAAAVRIENGSLLRVIAAAHRDAGEETHTAAFVGVRAFNPDAEKKFFKSISEHKTIVLQDLRPGQIAKTTWPYLSSELRALAPTATVTVPLFSRGNTYGAIIAYNNEGRHFTESDIELLTEIGKHASISMENAEVFERERHIAQTLQDSLLPPSLPDVDDLTFDAVYLPSSDETQVGGDWYDAFALEDGSIVVSAGDAMGRGPYAAVVMGKVRHLLAIATSYEDDPARVLDAVEKVLARRYPDVIVTAFVGIIDPARQKMTYANAGHPPAVIRRASSTEELHAEGLPLGLRRIAAPAKSKSVDLRDARMLVLYTDGLTEATHDVLEGHRRLHEVVLSQAILHTHSPARFIEASCLKARAEDDVAILTVSFESAVRWAFDAESAKAAQDARGEFVRYLADNTADSGEIAMAELVFGELVGNVVRHAPGPIDVDVHWDGEFPELHVIDRGAKFEDSHGLPTDELSEGGRGLFIVRQLSRGVTIEHVEGYGNHVTVRLPLKRK
jgi:PAS domain S-box-containing protein